MLFRPSSLLAIDVEEDVIRGVVVKRSGDSYEAIEMVQMERTGGGRDKFLNPEDLDGLVEKLKGPRPKFAVMCAHDVTLIDITLDARKVRKMDAAQLSEAVRWEAEPYCKVQARDMLVGHEVGRKNENNEFEIRVAVAHQEEFGQLTDSLKHEGIKLLRLYPQDVCFPVAAVYADGPTDKLAMDVGPYMSRVVRLEGGKPAGHQTVPFGFEMISRIESGESDADVDKNFADAIRVIQEDTKRIVLSGPGASMESVLNYVRRVSGLETAAWKPGVRGGLGDKPSENAQYAGAIGAAMREMGFGKLDHGIGIGSDVKFSRLVGEHSYMLPAAVGALILVMMFARYVYATTSTAFLAKENASLVKTRDSTSGEDSEVSRIVRRTGEYKMRERLLRNRIQFARTGGSDSVDTVRLVLRALIRIVPANVSLTNVAQQNATTFTVQGKGETVEAVNSLSTALQSESWCQSARAVVNKADNEKDPGARYSFSMTVTLHKKGAQ